MLSTNSQKAQGEIDRICASFSTLCRFNWERTQHTLLLWQGVGNRCLQWPRPEAGGWSCTLSCLLVGCWGQLSLAELGPSLIGCGAHISNPLLSLWTLPTLNPVGPGMSGSWIGGSVGEARAGLERELKLQLCQTTAPLLSFSSWPEQAEGGIVSQHGHFPQSLHSPHWASTKPGAGKGGVGKHEESQAGHFPQSPHTLGSSSRQPRAGRGVNRDPEGNSYLGCPCILPLSTFWPGLT